jgi:hypothetical protein
MKRSLGLLLGLPMVTLALGTAIGIAVARPDPIETYVIPPPSLKHSEMAQDFCLRSSVFADLSKAGEHQQKRVEVRNVWTTPIADRGAICTVEGMLLTKQFYSESATVTTEQVRATFIIAITGESEVVTEEFAKALVSSPVITGMASNKGNDGTVVPKVKLNF